MVKEFCIKNVLNECIQCLLRRLNPRKTFLKALNNKQGNSSLLFSELSFKVNIEMLKIIACVLQFYVNFIKIHVEIWSEITKASLSKKMTKWARCGFYQWFRHANKRKRMIELIDVNFILKWQLQTLKYTTSDGLSIQLAF